MYVTTIVFGADQFANGIGKGLMARCVTLCHVCMSQPRPSRNSQVTEWFR
ncbi:hypothetical protein X737_33920 [Mesorhizobium sp. L48C026A00]|nr:hypothetical protein X737_33920 [Mesorhizobium sp. L48C026A00]